MSRPAADALARAAPSFRLGTKEVFIPAHVVTLLHKPHQPPNWAMFQVPLRFSKFDLRDYLWNLYGLEAKKIRSVVKISPPENSRRAPSTKFMTIEMDQPFVWPEAPEDKEAWNQKMYQARERNQEKQWKQMMARSRGHISTTKEDAKSEARKSLRKQAEALLRGEKEWKNDNKVEEKPL
ncbi:hypothetical protein F5X68DRAFT_225552 [Plectosphaerella plurivora]|uniref:Large ribosomal subunit protein uL23m n=1 Tax=Plectosphaerella plurivora TaxID=936078 RepID=A0A9P8V2J6_9PEZI|nr:hypothetical protein F5X68DRAFT_225552 [Plectosphaerella plurivora]